MTIEDNILIRKYLLGDVTQDEQRRVEGHLMGDDEYFNLLCRTETDLMDEYVRGVLSPQDRIRFERHFMSAPERRESVAFAEVLNASLSSRVSQNTPTSAGVKAGTLPLSSIRSFDLRTGLLYLSTIIIVSLSIVAAL